MFYKIDCKVRDSEGRPPPLRTEAFISLGHCHYNQASTVAQKKAVAKKTSCKSLLVIAKLPAHQRTKQEFPDPIHTITNVLVKLLSLFLCQGPRQTSSPPLPKESVWKKQLRTATSSKNKQLCLIYF